MASGIVVKTSFQEQLNKIADLGKLYIRQEFTGGTDDALDSIDGSNLQTGVSALVIKDNVCYPYKYIDGATDPENPPYVITPDTNPNGRWFLNLVNNSDMIDGFHASQSPSANTIPVLDSNGQLWLPFNQTPILVNGQDMMSRTFYVDAVNGDDNNDGSESAPFKTLQKAVNSVLIGGTGYICLGSDYEVTTPAEKIEIRKRHIHIDLNGHIIRTTCSVSPTFNLNRLNMFFSLYGSTLTFHVSSGSQIIIDNEGMDSNLGWVGQLQKFVRCSTEILSTDNIGGRSLLGIEAYYSTSDTPFLVIDSGPILIGPEANSQSSLDGYDVNIVAHQGKAVVDGVIAYVGAPVNFHWYVNTVEDSNGNSVNIADKISGIIKDANGVPRNILSNIVF